MRQPIERHEHEKSRGRIRETEDEIACERQRHPEEKQSPRPDAVSGGSGDKLSDRVCDEVGRADAAQELGTQMELATERGLDVCFRAADVSSWAAVDRMTVNLRVFSATSTR